MAIHLHQSDLPDGLTLGPVVAIDTETMGLDPRRDRLCVVQLSDGNGDAHLVQIAKGQTRAPNLERLLTDPKVQKLFHFGRFDIAVMKKAFGVTTAPVWCTKIASKLIRTFTDRHGLKYLLADLVGVDVSKQQQTSDWGAATLTEAQKEYAASDVLYLHQLKAELDTSVAALGAVKAAADEGFSYDQMLAAGDARGQDLIMDAVDALVTQTASIDRAVTALGLSRITFEGSESLDNPGAIFQ